MKCRLFNSNDGEGSRSRSPDRSPSPRNVIRDFTSRTTPRQPPSSARRERPPSSLLFGDEEDEATLLEVTPPSSRGAADRPRSPPSSAFTPATQRAGAGAAADDDLSSWLHKAGPSTARPARLRRQNSIFTNKLLLTAPRPSRAHSADRGGGGGAGGSRARYAATTSMGRRASATDLCGNFAALRLTPEAVAMGMGTRRDDLGRSESPASTSSGDELVGSAHSQDPFTFATHFVNEGPIGSGAFSQVYRARSKDDGKYYAVKRLKKCFVSKADREAKMQEMRMFLRICGDREASRHIIKYIQAWQEEGHLHVQMELCARGNLDEFVSTLEHHPRVPEETVWNWIGQLAAALACLHDADLVHLDLKPENIFLTREGELRLGDLGMTVTEEMVDNEDGDIRYMASECLNSRQKTAAMDIFSLGITAYEISCKKSTARSGGASSSSSSSSSSPSSSFIVRRGRSNVGTPTIFGTPVSFGGGGSSTPMSVGTPAPRLPRAEPATPAALSMRCVSPEIVLPVQYGSSRRGFLDSPITPTLLPNTP